MTSSWEIVPCYQKYPGSLERTALTRLAGTLTCGTVRRKAAGSACERADRMSSGTHSRRPKVGCSSSVQRCKRAAALECRDFLLSCRDCPTQASGFLARNRRSPRFARDSCNLPVSWRPRIVFPTCSILKNIFQSCSLWKGLNFSFFFNSFINSMLNLFIPFARLQLENPYSCIRLDIDQVRVHIQVFLQTAFILMP